jgi:hypothetical protein
MQLNENLVRERAYKIWESEGKPEGCADKHWTMACEYAESMQDDQADSYSTLDQDLDQDLQSTNETQQKKKGKHSRH